MLRCAARSLSNSYCWIEEFRKMLCLCLGPKRAGKTHLLRALQEPDSIDETTYSMPTMGTNLFTLNFPMKPMSTVEGASASAAPPPPTKTVPLTKRQEKNLQKTVKVLEIGGSMAPMWRRYFQEDISKVIYCVDTSNLCQISAAGVLLYSILAEPLLQRTKFLLVLTKMDYSYRQMRNEALLMLQMAKLQKQIRQNITIVEASAVSKVGLDKICEWLQKP